MSTTTFLVNICTFPKLVYHFQLSVYLTHIIEVTAKLVNKGLQRFLLHTVIPQILPKLLMFILIAVSLRRHQVYYFTVV